MILNIRLLGQVHISRNEQPISVRGSKPVALLAYLLVTGQAHSRQHLLDLLFDGPADPRASLRWTLSELRRGIGAHYILAERQQITFNFDGDYWLDVTAFEAGQTDLYQGDFLAGLAARNAFGFDEWALFERERLKRVYQTVLTCQLEAGENSGDDAAIIKTTHQLLGCDNLREEWYRASMRAYARQGRREAALAQFDLCRQVLKTELGVEPAAETVALVEAVRQGEIETARFLIPPHNLPAQSTLFVGREEKVAEIAQRLTTPVCRLLTLVGPGGIGKTRLAQEVAATQLKQFKHGVYFVPLAPLDALEAIVGAIAEALKFSFYERSNPRRQLLDYLRQKSLLLVLDNFEHLLEAVDLLPEILQAAPGVKILTTSRERLNLSGETIFTVTGLDFPATDIPEAATPAQSPATYSAVKLFAQTARQARSDFEPTGDDLGHISRICRLVQGMPLALLLAAAWVELLSPEEIAVEIDQSLDFLETGWKDMPERQQSLRAVFDHSWLLLSERERAVFQHLSVFRGGFTRAAAEAVTETSLRVLLSLVNKSLLQRAVGGRYEIHELLRQYGAEKLAQNSGHEIAARDRHSAYYCGFLQQRETGLKGHDQNKTLAEIEFDGENIRVAWAWAVDWGQVMYLAQAMDCLGFFYEWQAQIQEGEAAFRRATIGLVALGKYTAGSGEGPGILATKVLARTLAWQGHFCYVLGQTDLARQLQSRSLILLNSSDLAGQDIRSEKAFLLEVMGRTANVSSLEEARQLFEQSLALYRSLDDRWGMARMLSSLGWMTRQSGAYEEAQRLSEESLTLFRTLGRQKDMANVLDSLGFSALVQGQFAKAESFIRDSYEFYQETNNRNNIARGKRNLGVMFTLLGRFTEGYTLLEDSIAIYNDLDNRDTAIFSYSWSGFAQMHLGQYDQALVFSEQGLTLAREKGWRGVIANTLLVLGCVALVQHADTKAQEYLQESVAIYQALGQHHELAVTLAALGYVERKLNCVSQARQYLCQALQAVTTGVFYPLVMALPAVALLLADQGQPKRAVEIYAQVSCFPYIANSHWFEDVAGREIMTVAAALSPEVVAAAQERSKSRGLTEVVAEIVADYVEDDD